MVAVGVPGRLIPAFLADQYFGPLSTLIPVVLLAAIMLLSWIGVVSVSGLYAFSALYGLAGAGIQSFFVSTFLVVSSVACVKKHVQQLPFS